MDEAGTRERLPPGQVLTEKWPVLTYGGTPGVDLEKWTFRCFGLVEKELSWSWLEFQKLPRVAVVSDIHCVTRWSRLENRWEGVALREVFERARSGRKRRRPSRAPRRVTRRTSRSKT